MDTKAQSVTIFGRDDLAQTIKVDGTISDPLLPGLILPLARLFRKTPMRKLIIYARSWQ